MGHFVLRFCNVESFKGTKYFESILDSSWSIYYNLCNLLFRQGAFLWSFCDMSERFIVYFLTFRYFHECVSWEMIIKKYSKLFHKSLTQPFILFSGILHQVMPVQTLISLNMCRSDLKENQRFENILLVPFQFHNKVTIANFELVPISKT